MFLFSASEHVARIGQLNCRTVEDKRVKAL